MIAFLTIIYLLLLFLLIKVRVLPNKKWVWFTVVPYNLLLTIGLLIPMQWGAPTGNVITLTHSVQIVPNVAGEVIELTATPNTPLKKGDVLFRIDPAPYQFQVDAIKAQLTLAETRLSQSKELVRKQVGRQFDVQQHQAQVDQLSAQLETANYNLRATVIRAPADGYVTNVSLRPGARVTNLPLAPAMAFIDTSGIILGAQVAQNFYRNIELGQKAEVVLKTHPGKVFEAKVVAILQATAQGQVPLSGFAPVAQSPAPGPFFVRLELVDEDLAKTIPAGAVGSMAIYTEEAKMTHLIRKVMMRMEAWINYINPF